MGSITRIVALALPIVELALQLLEAAKSQDPDTFNRIVQPRYKSASDRYAALMSSVTDEDLGEIDPDAVA